MSFTYTLGVGQCSSAPCVWTIPGLETNMELFDGFNTFQKTGGPAERSKESSSVESSSAAA